MIEAKPAASEELSITVAINVLPPLPAVAHEIIATLGDEFVDGNNVADTVERDPAICARLLGLANSAYFGLRRPVSNMREVVNRVLGTDTVRSLALALATKQSFDVSRCPKFDAELFWRRALTSASSCKRIAAVVDELQPVEREFAYALGLCHNLGLMALAYLEPDKLNDVLLIDRAKSGQSLSELLRASFGQSGEDFTVALATHWSMPEPLLAAYRDRAAASSTVAAAPLTMVLKAGIRAAEYVETTPEEPDEKSWFDEQSKALGFEPDTLSELALPTERQRESIEGTVALFTV